MKLTTNTINALLNTTLVQAVLVRHNSEATNSRVLRPKNF